MKYNATYNGRLIASTPGWTNDELENSVVLVIEDLLNIGTTGVLLNKPGTISAARLLEQLEVPTNDGLIDSVFYGGAGDERAVILVHSNEWSSTNTAKVTSNISMSSDMFMLEKLAYDNIPHYWKIVAGKVWWEPGLLQSEIENNMWVDIPASLELVFITDHEDLWDETIAICAKEAVRSWL